MGVDRWEGLERRRIWPDLGWMEREGSRGWGGYVKMGLVAWVVPMIDMWEGQMERMTCLGTVMPRRISECGKLTDRMGKWIARR